MIKYNYQKNNWNCYNCLNEEAIHSLIRKLDSYSKHEDFKSIIWDYIDFMKSLENLEALTEGVPKFLFYL